MLASSLIGLPLALLTRLVGIGVAILLMSLSPLVHAETTPTLTVITHGFNSGATNTDSNLLNPDDYNWVNSMAASISDRNGGGVPIYSLEISRSLTGIGVTRSLPGLPITFDATKKSAILKVDWSRADASVGCFFGVYPTEIPTGMIAQQIVEFLLQNPEALKLPIHLIGHSRGGSVMTEVARMLGQRGLWVDQLTTLDPHPVLWRLGCDVAVGQVFQNTIFADNYWRADALGGFTGQSILGSHNVDLNGILTPSVIDVMGNHVDVHTYYHGTIDTLVQRIDGRDILPAWYSYPQSGPRATKGYYFARNGGGYQSRGAAGSDGLLWPMGGDAQRWLVPLLNLETYPNIQLQPLASYSYLVGDTISIPFFYQDRKNEFDIKFEFDSDTNPFNTNSAACQQLTAGLISSNPQGLRPDNTSIRQFSFPLDTSSAAPGSCFLRAKITNPYHVRYDYLPTPISIGSYTPPDIPPGTATFTVPPNSGSLPIKTLTIPGAKFIRVTTTGSIDSSSWGGDITIWQGTDTSQTPIRQLSGAIASNFTVAGSSITVQYSAVNPSPTGAGVSIVATTSTPSNFDVPPNGLSSTNSGPGVAFAQVLTVPGAQNIRVTTTGSIDSSSWGGAITIWQGTDTSQTPIRRLSGAIASNFTVAGSSITVQYSTVTNSSPTGAGVSIVVATTSTPSNFDVPPNGFSSAYSGPSFTYAQVLTVPGAQNISVTTTGSIDSSSWGGAITIWQGTDTLQTPIRHLSGAIASNFNVAGSSITVQYSTVTNTLPTGARVEIVGQPSYPPDSIYTVTGSPQSTLVSTNFGTPLQAVVRDTQGNPLSGITVTFTTPTAGPSASFAGNVKTAVTNVSGIATSVAMTANSTAGTYYVAASVANVPSVAVFALTNTPPAPSGCSIAPLSPTSALGATAQAFTATCASGGAPTSYDWTVDGVAVAGSANIYTTVANLGLGAHPVTFTAKNAGGSSTPAATTLTVNNPIPQTIGVITFTVNTLVVGGTTTVSATASSGLLVTFGSASGGVCTVSFGNVVTGVAAGFCTIVANQAGSSVYAPAVPVVGVISVVPGMSIPGSPTILSITPGQERVTMTLQPPSNTGGGTIVGYSATCTASGHPNVPGSSVSSTVVVSGLVPGVSYSCTASANNGSYASAPSGAATVIPKPKVDLTPILMLLLD